MLNWTRLLNGERRKPNDSGKERVGPESRTPFEMDYDRILFATPTRRLADKTQVFPMEEHDSVRNRLTHSHEVSNLARSIGVRLAFLHAEEVFGEGHENLQVKRNVPAILAAAGLAHDLGNPPFGHQGEASIQDWFKSKVGKIESIDDFHSFDGNAQTFRLLVRLQLLNDRYGLDLTVGTLAAIIKYPSVYGSQKPEGMKKHGVFQSERGIVQDVWDMTGLEGGTRHPLAYVMEACDDIAYSIIDAEDTVKKGYASYYDLVEHLKANAEGDPVVKAVTDQANKKHDEFRKVKLTSRELNDISMQMFRVYAIRELVDAATKEFVQNSSAMIDGSIEPGFELIESSSAARLCSLCKDFDKRYGFRHPEVIKQELIGHNHIHEMMDFQWDAIGKHDNHSDPFSRYVFGRISENYRRVYQDSDRDNYSKCQLLCDSVSGMTESYLLKMCYELRALSNESTSA